VLDTEMVHAIAPGAAIVEVLVNASSLNNAARGVAASVAALRLGTSVGSVISISAAGQTGGAHCETRSEVAALHAALETAAADHVTVVAASGDIGVVGEPCQLFKGLTGGAFPLVKEVNLPASDPLVLAAGGTTLAASHKTGAYIGESAWGLPFGNPGTEFQASGGGLGGVFSRPAYQDHVRDVEAYRAVPDVGADAAPHTGMEVVTASGNSSYTITASGGTSASAPMWAALVALADQRAGHRLGFVNAAIYRIGRRRPLPQGVPRRNRRRQHGQVPENRQPGADTRRVQLRAPGEGCCRLERRSTVFDPLRSLRPVGRPVGGKPRSCVRAPSARLTRERRLVNGIRPPVVAGSFYPGTAAELAATSTGCL
jgi:subtilase family serine protease